MLTEDIRGRSQYPRAVADDVLRAEGAGPDGHVPPCMDVVAHPAPHRAQAYAPGRVRMLHPMARARVSPRLGAVGAP